jgi:ATP-dependent Clp protease ATP-binding subunit ClpA
LGVSDAEAVVDARYPVSRPPLPGVDIRRRARRLAAYGASRPSPGPIPPIFERFTPDARDAIDAGVEYARRLDDSEVETAHLLYGVLNAEVGAVATVRTRYGWQLQPPVQSVQSRYPRATGIFSSDARRIVAEDMLLIADRLDHRALTTGHLLIALLESPDERTSEIISSLPDVREITTAVIDALPGEKHRDSGPPIGR